MTWSPQQEEASPRPWQWVVETSPNGDSVKIVDARGGVVALIKAGGGRKRANAALIVLAVNGLT